MPGFTFFKSDATLNFDDMPTEQRYKAAYAFDHDDKFRSICHAVLMYHAMVNIGRTDLVQKLDDSMHQAEAFIAAYTLPSPTTATT